MSGIAGNALTGCLPAAANDLAATGLPFCPPRAAPGIAR